MNRVARRKPDVPMNILIVDDIVTNRKLLRVSLEAEGYSSVEADDGVAALQILERERPDAVVSDILMPRMDGYRLCQEIWRREGLRDLPFIVYSSTYTSPAKEQLARDLGADEFIKRPSPIRLILEAINRLTATETGHAGGPARTVPQASVMKEYSEMLVQKLEEKNVELEAVQEQLLGANQRLKSSTEQLERSKLELRQINDQLEHRVRQRTAELAGANRELEAFLYAISHDLRAPLRAIDGFTGFLLKDFLSEFSAPAQRYLHAVTRNARSMGRLIDDLLTFDRLRRRPLNVTTVSAAPMVRQLADELRAKEPGRPCEFRLGPLPDCRADPSLLLQVWWNLLDNAFKFTRGRNPACIEVGSRLEPDAIVYFVRDNGVGFDMRYVDKLFGVFQRLHSSDEFDGTGMGLSIAQRILLRHGGRIWAEAKPDHGATFHFALPL